MIQPSYSHNFIKITSIMRKLLKFIAVFFVLLIALVVALPFVIPAEVLKAKALEAVQTYTGRKVSMGAVSFSILPNIALKAQDVVIGNPTWVKGETPMASIKSLRLGVELMPLLHKQVHVTDVALESPTLLLVKNGNDANWQFKAAGAPANAPAAAQKEEAAPSAAPPIHLDSFSVSNGMLTYEDYASGGKQVVKDLDLKLKGKDLPASMNLTTSAVYNGTKVSADVTLGNPMTITAGKPSAITLDATYGPQQIQWKGSVALKGGIPSITGDVTLPEVDTTANKSAQGEGKAAAPAAHSGERWSTDPINLSGLKAANADINLTIGKLVLSSMTLSSLTTHVKLQDGTLQTNIDDYKLFSGLLKLALTAKHTGQVSMKINASKMNVQEALTVLAKSKAFEGTLNSDMDLTMQGHSQKEFISSLAGSGKIALTEGLFHGGNLLNMTRNIATAFQKGGANDDVTDFKSLSGSFTAKDGVIFNNDLNMEGRLLSLTGKGQIDLPNWMVHYLLTPTAITNRGNETKAASGISVPVQVEGSLDAPTYHPELGSLIQDKLKNPEKLKEDLKNIKDIKKDLKINKDTLKGLLGR